jgi:hypothetical protein
VQWSVIFTFYVDMLCTRFLWENPKERDHSEGRGVNGRMELEWILGRLAGGGGGGGFSCLRIGTCGGIL